MCDEFGSGDGLLVAAAHRLDDHGAVGDFFSPMMTAIAASLRLACFIWAFMLRLSKLRSPRSRQAQFGGDRCGFETTDDIDDVGVEIERLGGETRLRRRRQAACGRRRGRSRYREWRATEGFDEAVVATAAAEGVLRGVEGAALELEDGAAVVVEPAHQFRLDGKRDVEGPQAGLDRSKWFAASPL